MISQSTIDRITAAAEVLDVVKRFEPNLKQRGSSWEACCPFHKENTPSFRVHPAKGIYKCFGCGKGGNAVNFIMDHEKKTYPEAIEYLAGLYNIDVEYDGDYDPQALQEKRDAIKERTQILAWAENWYHEKLMETPLDGDVWQKLMERGYTEETVRKWRLGYAPPSNRNITEPIINMGMYKPAFDLGLVRTTKGLNYDFYQNRIIIPIKDSHGVVCGFGGRWIGDAKADNQAKYYNPQESEAYEKKNILFALSEAQPEFKATGFAYLMEGYFDVITAHEHGIKNAIAPCGTALTTEQIRLIKRFFDHTAHVVLVGDGDSAGIKAMEKQIDLLLMHDFRVEVAILPEGEDPDSFIRSLKDKNENAQTSIAA